MKLTVLNAARIAILTPVAMILTYCCYHFVTTEKRPMYVDCGVVKSKSNDEVVIKHGYRTELYLNIQFEKSGFKSIKCSPTLYFSKKKGDRVCFKLREKKPKAYHVYNAIGALTLAWIIFYFSISLILYLCGVNMNGKI